MMPMRIKNVDVTAYGRVGFTKIIVRREMMLMMKGMYLKPEMLMMRAMHLKLEQLLMMKARVNYLLF